MIGKIVKHKTGGPKMAIVAETDSMYATSWWSDDTHSFQSGWFMKELLS